MGGIEIAKRVRRARGCNAAYIRGGNSARSVGYRDATRKPASRARLYYPKILIRAGGASH